MIAILIELHLRQAEALSAADLASLGLLVVGPHILSTRGLLALSWPRRRRRRRHIPRLKLDLPGVSA